MSIYRPCDIRGDSATELSSELYQQWGTVLGHQIPDGAKFVVGGDFRTSTPPFLTALVAGLSNAGADCIDLGQIPTPMVYYAQRRLAAAGCAIVTASHNQATMNGLKWMLGARPPRPEEVDQLAAPAHNGVDRVGRKPRDLDISFDYVAWQQETWVDSLRARLHVVLDPMHGAWARRARRYLNAVFPECLVSVVRDEPHGQFEGCSPDCSHADNLVDLCTAVHCQRADLGIAFDGDGDRIALVDNEGIPLTGEEATWLLLQTFGPRLAGKRFVYDVKFSDRVPQIARALGAEPVVSRSGQGFLRARMGEVAGAFGAELSGHYFFDELAGGDDGLFAACRTIAFLARSGKTLAELRKQCPPLFVTPDLRIAVEPALQEQVLAEVRAAWSHYPQATLDGVRIELPVGWALVRRSVTEPALTFRFEATDWPELHELVSRFCRLLPSVGEKLWHCYQTSTGVAE